MNGSSSLFNGRLVSSRSLPAGFFFSHNPDEDNGGVALCSAEGDVLGFGDSEAEALADQHIAQRQAAWSSYAVQRNAQ